MYTIEQYEADLRARLARMPDAVDRKAFIDKWLIRYAAANERRAGLILAGKPNDVPAADYAGILTFLSEERQQAEYQADRREDERGDFR